MSESHVENAVIIAALLSTTLISLAPNLILLLSPNYASSYTGSNKRSTTSTLLCAGQALASGALLGDVFLHTLPHTLLGKDEESIMRIGLSIIAGFVIFFALDVFVRYMNDAAATIEGNSNDKKTEETSSTSTTLSLSPMMILNLAGDALHNFTDGIAIGASFASTASALNPSATLSHQVISLLKSHGGLASLAVLFHEIPHELGDFAVLVSAGMSKSQAIKAQFLTATAAFCGTVVGLFAMGRLEQVLGYDVMIPLTAGGFVYIATVNILSDLLNEGESSNASDRLLQIVSFLFGVGFMYVVAMMEEHDHDHGHHHHNHGGGHGHGHHHHDHHSGHGHGDHHHHHHEL